VARKTKVRIVGDPELASHIAMLLSDFYEFEKAPERYQRAVGRDYSHSEGPGVTIYITVKKPTLAGEIHFQVQQGHLDKVIQLQKEVLDAETS